MHTSPDQTDFYKDDSIKNNTWIRREADKKKEVRRQHQKMDSYGHQNIQRGKDKWKELVYHKSFMVPQ